MILSENKRILRAAAPHIWDSLKRLEDNANTEDIAVISSKSGLPSIAVKREERQLFLHSKYDPVHEAERWVEQYTSAEVAKYKHILFYGVGMGYHVEAFLQKFPGKEFSLYEPEPIIFYHYSSHRELSHLPLQQLKKIQLESNPEDRNVFFELFMTNIMNGDVLFVPFPGYERIFTEKYKQFSEQFLNVVSNKRFSVGVDTSFEKLWIINSFRNLPETLRTPDILHVPKDMFFGKPAMIVAAGPSLEDEIENLRYIKQNRLAYIFSVGSAIHTLLDAGIEPDGACTYDPQEHNHVVFSKVLNRGIKTIPLIYGTSVGYPGLERYPGPRFHMITSQDTVAAFYLKRKDELPLDRVQDAPSVAIITLQLLMKLGCQPIYLVGQNLAYRGERYYAGGIPYYSPTTNMELMRGAIQVEDVYGNMTYTNESFNKMREEIERYILANPQYEVLNTTKGGAKIAGTTFVLLEEEIEKRLLTPVVPEKWYENVEEAGYDIEYVRKKSHTMELQIQEFYKRVKEIYALFKEIHSLIEAKNATKLGKMFAKFDKLFKKFIKNRVVQFILQPMNRVQHELLLQKVAELRFDDDVFDKARKVMNIFGSFIQKCQLDLERISRDLRETHDLIQGRPTGRSSIEEVMGQRFSFTRINDYISFNNQVIPLGAKTIRFKVRVPAAANQFMYIFSNLIYGGHGTAIRIDDEGKLAFQSSKGELKGNMEDSRFFISTPHSICDNNWHEVIATWDGTTRENGVKLFVDDLETPVATGTATALETIDASCNLLIGKYNNYHFPYYFVGELDEIQIYAGEYKPM